MASNVSLLLDQLQELAILRHGETFSVKLEIAQVLFGYQCALFLKPILRKPMPVMRELIDASERMVTMIDDVLAFFRGRPDAAFDDIPAKLTEDVQITMGAFSGAFRGHDGDFQDLWALLLEPLISCGDRSLLSDGSVEPEPEYYL